MYVFTPKWLSFRVLLLGGKLCIWEPVGSSIINHIDGSDCSNLVYSMTSTILSIIFCKRGSSKGALEEKSWTNCTNSLFMIMAAIGYVLLCNWSIQTKKQIHGPCMSKKNMGDNNSHRPPLRHNRPKIHQRTTTQYPRCHKKISQLGAHCPYSHHRQRSKFDRDLGGWRSAILQLESVESYDFTLI